MPGKPKLALVESDSPPPSDEDVASVCWRAAEAIKEAEQTLDMDDENDHPERHELETLSAPAGTAGGTGDLSRRSRSRGGPVGGGPARMARYSKKTRKICPISDKSDQDYWLTRPARIASAFEWRERSASLKLSVSRNEATTLPSRHSIPSEQTTARRRGMIGPLCIPGKRVPNCTRTLRPIRPIGEP